MHSIYKQHMLRELCNQIPKAELHVHLEGTFELNLMEKLAKKHGIEVPQEVRDLKTAERFDLKTFFDAYVSACTLLRDEEDFAEILVAYLKKVSTQGVRYAEVMIDVQNHMARGVAFDTIFHGLKEGVGKHREIARIAKAKPIEVKFIVSLVGERDVREAMDVV